MDGGGPGPGPADDLRLAHRAARGDRAAFGELARRAVPVVSAVLRRAGASEAVADDVTQDALISALRWIATYRGEAAFSAWASQIAARLYLKQLRRSGREVLMADPVDDHLAGDCDARATERRLDLERALARLSPQERLCVTLCHGVGLTHEDLSRALRMPLGTVKSHVARGLEKLRARMTKGRP